MRLGFSRMETKGQFFSDEVDALSAGAQVKILRVLQEREYRPVGSAHTIPANIRIVAATNCNLLKRVEAHQFREDLYFRLNILSLTIPPLRERLEDLPILASHYLREYATVHRRQVTGINDDAIASLQAYRWPGNVREFQAVMQRAVLTARTPALSTADLALPETTPAPSPHLTLKAAKNVAVSHCERSYLSAVLLRCEGNITRAAKMAGKERRSFPASSAQVFDHRPFLQRQRRHWLLDFPQTKLDAVLVRAPWIAAHHANDQFYVPAIRERKFLASLGHATSNAHQNVRAPRVRRNLRCASQHPSVARTQKVRKEAALEKGYWCDRRRNCYRRRYLLWLAAVSRNCPGPQSPSHDRRPPLFKSNSRGPRLSPSA